MTSKVGELYSSKLEIKFCLYPQAACYIGRLTAYARLPLERYAPGGNGNSTFLIGLEMK